jgi:hypothetical protein
MMVAVVYIVVFGKLGTSCTFIQKQQQHLPIFLRYKKWAISGYIQRRLSLPFWVYTSVMLFIYENFAANCQLTGAFSLYWCLTTCDRKSVLVPNKYFYTKL